MASQPQSHRNDSQSFMRRVKPLLFIGMAILIFWATFRYGGFVQLDELVARESQLRDFATNFMALALVLAFVAYVFTTGVSLPGAAILSLVYGWLFGFFAALIVVSFASTLGATLAFLTSRYFLRDTIRNRFRQISDGFNHSIEREGAFYLFSLRLIPVVPFFIVNLVMGLTSIRLRTFYWVSQIGMLPGTIAYVYAGSTIPDLKSLHDQGLSGIITPQLLIGFTLLGVLPLVIKKLISPHLLRDEYLQY